MSWITRSISNRLFAVSLSGLAILLAIAITSITRLTDSLDEHQNLVQEMEHALQIERLNKQFKTQVQEWKNVLIRGSDDNNREKYWQRFQQAQKNVQNITAELVQRLTVPATKAKLQDFQRVHAQLATKYRKGYDSYIDSGFNVQAGDQAVQGIDREPSKLLLQASQMIEEYVTKEAKVAAEHASSVTTMAIPSVLIIAFIVLIGMYLLVNRQVVAPLKQLQQHAKKFGEGDFTSAINLSRHDEIGTLAGNLDAMKQNISGILKEVSSTTTSLAQTAEQLDQAANELTSNTSNAERNLDSTSAGMTEMATVAHDVATCANDANSTANLVEQSATKGLGTMNETISAINILAEQVESVTETMAKLEHDSANVGSVLDVIKGIAEQTNLLALNAAIEAARAGEQGRGFAVVADEVRTLAQRTQESTEEINQIIQALQQAATGAARMMDENRERTLESAQLAGKAGESIQQIVDEVEQIRKLSNQIFTATEEQKSAASTIDENITSVATVASETHHLAQNTRSVAEELSSAAHRLTDVVGKFRI